jgi:hypothetical protein
MMLPPTQLWDRRTYGSENLCSATQKEFFDSIGQKPKAPLAIRMSGPTT